MPIRSDVLMVGLTTIVASTALFFFTVPRDEPRPAWPANCAPHSVEPALPDAAFSMRLQGQADYITADLGPRPDFSYHRFTQPQVGKILALQKQMIDQHEPAIMAKAELTGARFDGLDLSGLDLHEATLICADFTSTKLDGANFFNAQMDRVNLSEVTSAIGARFSATLRQANFFRARLDRASLDGADLSGASFDRTSLKNATISGANLTGATWDPISIPAGAALGGLRGLRTLLPVTPALPASGRAEPVLAGLQVLRIALRSAGEISAEGEITHAYAVARTNQLFASAWQEHDVWDGLLGVSRFILWGWMTDYGLAPWRCLLGVLIVLLLGVPLYLSEIPLATTDSSARLLRVIPKEAPRATVAGVGPGMDDEFTRLHGGHIGWRIGWAIYVSLIGTVGVGVGDINLGEWFARLRLRDESIATIGWLRVVAGGQSLISTLILAIWALAVFGQPFD